MAIVMTGAIIWQNFRIAGCRWKVKANIETAGSVGSSENVASGKKE